MSLTGSCISTFGPCLMMPFGKAVEPLGGRTLLEEVGHW